MRPVAFILTADRTRSIVFYRDTMGFALTGQDAYGATFDMGGLQVRLTDIPDHRGGPHPVLGWEVADLRARMAELVSRGVVFSIYEGMGQDESGVWASPDGAVLLSWFADPDGNMLSLSQHMT